MVEADLERAEERAESGESYVSRAIVLCVACFFTESVVLSLLNCVLVTIFVSYA
jgi:hypothetical protein